MGSQNEKPEDHQIKNIYFEADVPLNNVSTKAIDSSMRISFVMAVILVVLSFWVEIPREINFPFKIMGGYEETIFQYPEKIYLVKKFVSAGGAVESNKPLIRISSPRILELITQVEEGQEELIFFKEFTALANQEEQQKLRVRVSQLSNEIQTIKKEIRVIDKAKTNEKTVFDQQLATSEKQFRRDEELNRKKVISDLNLERSFQLLNNVKQEMIQRLEDYNLRSAQLQTELQKLESQKAYSEQELKSMVVKHELEEARIVQNQERAHLALKNHFGNYQINGRSIDILSTGAGTISYVTEEEYEVLPGEIVLRLSSDVTDFYAYGEVSSTKLGDLKKGQKAVLKYNSYPYYYYGTMTGNTATVAQSPSANGTFPVTISITDGKNLKNKITKGMSGTVNVVIEEKPLVDYVIRNFKKVIAIDQ